MLLYVLLAYTLATLTLVSSRNQAPIIATEIPTARLADIGTSHQDDYASFSHPSFPRHGLRIKKVHDFCDPTVNVYSGFLDFTSGGSKHLFFWFFESRSSPATDDVLMWINGGPGGSSGLGAFMELGPCSIDLHAEKESANRTVWNPYSWNANANIFFLEQPVGVGWSYADYGTHVQDTPEAARDVNAFVNMFFDVFDEFKGRAFHLAGESYGGRYIPLFAAEIYDGRRKALQEGRSPVNLQSILIGNGRTSPHEVIPSKYDMLCTTATGHAPVVNIDTCIRLKRALPYCKRMLQSGCVDQLDVTECTAARKYCDGMFEGTVQNLQLNRFDLRKKCVGDDDLCYAEAGAIKEWLNLNATRKQLGIPGSVPAYNLSSDVVAIDFDTGGDRLYRSDTHVAQLLERGIRVLIYAGVADFACSWVGNKRTYEALDWSGHEAFTDAVTRDWTPVVDVIGRSSDQKPEVAGSIKSAHGLTFLTINEAGHMVPYDKPKEALAMLQAWLKKELV